MAAELFPFIPDALGRAFEADDPALDTKAHERPHVESIQRLLAGISAGDLDSCLSVLDPDIEFVIHCPPIFPFTRHARGIEGFRQAVAHDFSVLEAQDPKILHLVAQGGIVDVTVVETGRIRSTGEPYDAIGVLQFVFKAGKIALIREILSLKTPTDG